MLTAATAPRAGHLPGEATSRARAYPAATSMPRPGARTGTGLARDAAYHRLDTARTSAIRHDSASLSLLTTRMGAQIILLCVPRQVTDTGPTGAPNGGSGATVAPRAVTFRNQGGHLRAMPDIPRSRFE
jgi:hypothetical protein